MTDTEFLNEVKRGVGVLVAACIRRFGVSWRDIIPRHEARMIAAFDEEHTTVAYDMPLPTLHILRDSPPENDCVKS